MLLVLALSGCAAAIQIGPTGPDPDPAYSDGVMPPNEILITRPSEAGFLTNVGTRPAILIGGREVGHCNVGRPLLLRVADGSWVVTARTAAGEVRRTVTVRGGETARLTCTTSPDPSLRPLPVLNPG